MLKANKLDLLKDLIKGSTKEELAWISGYLAGILSGKETIASGSPAQDQPVAAKPVINKITIAYGTETGNAKKLASDFAAKAKKAGINAKLVSLDQYRINDLAKEEYFFTVVSTQGDGEPPAGAKKFYEHIHNNGFRVNNMKYGVLALGDTAYPLFCKVGEDVDSQLNKLGGQRFVALQKCDTDYEEDASNWFTQVLESLNKQSAAAISAPSVITKKKSGKKTYTGTILANINLNDRGSGKQTHHVEIAAEDVDYQPGDSLGIIPSNAVHTVDAVLTLVGQDKNKKVSWREEELSVFDLLKKRLNIIYLSERVIKKYATVVEQEIPPTKIGLLDLLKIYPLKNAEQFDKVIEILEPIAPRLYSISSSPEAHAGEVHLTVARDKFFVNGEAKYGLCSDYFSQAPVGSEIEFYIHKNTLFRLPEESKDIIMIGPGTGVAPFRSFVAHRDAIGANGRNWLFFGDQHFTTDFLYQSEWQSWLETGVLTNVSVAFSRDQKEKVYVQHKMQKHGQELFEWLDNGGYLYVCGAKDPMSTDVENALLEIIQVQGKKSEKEAIIYMDELREQGRYLKDVY